MSIASLTLIELTFLEVVFPEGRFNLTTLPPFIFQEKLINLV